jgi:hypothetical protein
LQALPKAMNATAIITFTECWI